VLDKPRLIEVAFPLKQTSLDSIHEKNVRHGHISTLHIWPARRPLAACRAALIATLLPDPGNAEERKKLLEKLGGRIVQVVKRKKLPSGKIEEKIAEETIGGILHWGRESSPDLDWFREEIRKAYGGRAPKVLDPFAGGGAIPLEAMRLGCEVTASDINPVAWFILKCTLEYPQKLAGQKRLLPPFVLKDRDFMESFFKAQGFKGALLRTQLEKLGLGETPQPQLAGLKIEEATLEADLAWHVRAWGWWVLQKAKADLERFYPMAEGKPTVAYLWARTVKCKNCRALVPLLKTRWLCKKDKKRVLLTMEPNADKTGVVFGVDTNVQVKGGNTAQRREYDKLTGVGTMSRSGATCPCCPAIVTSEDMRFEAAAGRLGATMTAVVVDGPDGKEYRLPTIDEVDLAARAGQELEELFASIPFGLPTEPVPRGGSRKGGGSPFTVHLYGLDQWNKLFTSRQLLALGIFVKSTRVACNATKEAGYPPEWGEAIEVYLATMLDRLANQSSAVSRWNQGGEKIEGTFARFALPILWDFAEVNPLGDTTGGYQSAFEWVMLTAAHCSKAAEGRPIPQCVCESAVSMPFNDVDVIVTDPPYYDAIPYSDLMDFFYVWIRRTLYGLSPEIDAVFSQLLAPKWDYAKNDGELIDDPSRFGGDNAKSQMAYEDGTFRAFQACHKALKPEGRLVIVFANKQPDAWETLVSAIIRAGFVVDGSWPIQTEMGTRTRALSSAALSSSVWLVCKKRPEIARPGWDNRVLEEMHENITTRLRDFWDAGIHGPDFVWAATGPALEVYSKHPVVKKANEPGQLMTVSEFLRHVRRIVVDFVVGRVLSHNGDAEAVSGLDDLTTYYLLHRHDFGMDDAPIGACILYAVSCSLSDSALANQFDLLIRTGGQTTVEEENEEAAAEEMSAEPEEGSGSTVKLKSWHQRQRKSMGYEAPGGRPVPLIDQIHRLLHLWKAGDVVKVDEYLDAKGLRRNALFQQILQALIELARTGSDERSLLESISNHVVARGLAPAMHQTELLPGSAIDGEPG
jgi:adenine-specific DNA methylase